MLSATLKQLLYSELQESFKETILARFWVVLEPVLITLVYVFVFATILGARETGMPGVGYPEFLVIALWPWLAISRSIGGSVNLVKQKSSLIKKLNIKSELFLYARCMAQFLIYGATFFVVLVVLHFMGANIHLTGLLVVLPVFFLLWVFSNASAMIVCALAVFIDDLKIIVPLFLTLAFFLMPIIWPAERLSADLSFLVDYNPLAGMLDYLRAALLQGELTPGKRVYAFVLLSLLLHWLGSVLYKRLSRYFLDVV